MSKEERLVRDAYIRLMRYQTSAVESEVSATGIPSKTEDYIVIELRNFRSGPISELRDTAIELVATSGSGDIVRLKPTHLVHRNGPPHAYYSADWIRTTSGAPRGKSAKLPEMLLTGGGRRSTVRRYTSYEVTVRLSGRQRSYRAIALHDSETESVARSSTLIIDNVITGLNTVLQDESPRVISPWEKYVRSALYLGVVKAIRDAEKEGKRRIPADAPLGYLPGDNAVPFPVRPQASVPWTYSLWAVGSDAGQTIVDRATQRIGVKFPSAVPSESHGSFTVSLGVGGNLNNFGGRAL